MVVNGVKDGENGWVKATGRKWNPSEGEYIIGVYIKTKHQINPNKPSEDLKRYIIKDGSDEVTVYGTTVLDDLFKDIPIGNEVCIEFTGTKSNKPPLSPTKLFEVHHRPVVEDDSTGAAGEDADLPQAATMNTHDAVEVAAFVDGVEGEVKGKSLDLIELNMLTEGKEMAGEDESFWKLAKEEILSRKYPASIGG